MNHSAQDEPERQASTATGQPVVLVTGASSGIGLCCAAFLSRNGYRVYGASRSAVCVVPSGQGKIDGDGVLPLPMDVTEDDSVRAGCDAIFQREGRLDVVINSAGMGIAGALEDTSPEEARQQFEVNLFGVLRVCRAMLPIMRRQRSGCIVNIGSIGGLIAIPYQGVYSASKFALEGLTESLRMEVRQFGIRVVLIEPGDHRTGFTGNRRLTNASSGDSAYRIACARAVQRMAEDEQAGPLPDHVARLVYRVIRARNPRLRYTTGPIAQRAAVWLKRLVPNSLMERIVSAYYAKDGQRQG